MVKYFNNVSIERNNEIISLTLEKEDNVEVEIYYNNYPEVNGNEKIIVTTLDNKVDFEDPMNNKRTFYILKADNYENYILGETLMPLEGLCNFRDLGGIKSKNGKRVKWNKFFRAEQLSTLTKNDFEFLDSIKFKTILDYRSIPEVRKSPDPEIKGAKYINISGMQALDKDDNDNFDMLDIIRNYNVFKELGSPVDYLTAGYKSMVFNNEAFKTLINCMENTEKLPIVQHCTAGKDRTGIGSALILLTLGVEEEKVVEDYMATNLYRKAYNDLAKEKLGDVLKSKEAEIMFDAIMKVRKEYIEETFAVIKKKYNTIDNYLEAEYGLTIEKREKLMAEYLY